MTNSTQLPAEVLEEIELKAEHEAALHFHPVYSRDQNTACRICYRNGAKEYATKLHQSNIEATNLKMSIIGLEDEIRVLKGRIGTHERSYDARSKDYDELDQKYEIAEELLNKFISRHEAGLLPDRFIY